MKTTIDDAISKFYLEFDTPADRVLSNDEHAATFHARICNVVGQDLQKTEVLQRLLYLRKKGKLPRLRRR